MHVLCIQNWWSSRTRRSKSMPWSSAMLRLYMRPRAVSCCELTSSASRRSEASAKPMRTSGTLGGPPSGSAGQAAGGSEHRRRRRRRRRGLDAPSRQLVGAGVGRSERSRLGRGRHRAALAPDARGKLLGRSARARQREGGRQHEAGGSHRPADSAGSWTDKKKTAPHRGPGGESRPTRCRPGLMRVPCQQSRDAIPWTCNPPAFTFAMRSPNALFTSAIRARLHASAGKTVGSERGAPEQPARFRVHPSCAAGV